MLKLRERRIILYLAAAFIIFGSIFWLYRLHSRIPDGIFLSGVSGEEIQGAYPDLCAAITPYETGEISGGGALLITPQKGAEQILPYTLQERYQKYTEVYVRDLAAERRMRLTALEALACLALFGFLNPLIFYLSGEKGKNYHYLLRIGEFFALCILISRRGVLPSVCIPEKFIYFGEWWEKSKKYFDSLKELGEIPCAAYQKGVPLQTGLFALMLVGMSVLVLARILGRKRL